MISSTVIPAARQSRITLTGARDGEHSLLVHPLRIGGDQFRLLSGHTPVCPAGGKTATTGPTLTTQRLATQSTPRATARLYTTAAAIRALSPAVNDPTTGVQAIDRISDLLAITGSRPDPTGLRVDSGGTVRVKRKLRNFDGLLVLSVTEVTRYGADAPQVARRLHAMLDELEATLPAERQAAIAGQRSLLEAAVSAALPAPFASVASVADREGLG